MRNLIIASTSTLHNQTYLEYLLPTLSTHFKAESTLIFIPYARPGGISHEDYTAKVREALAPIHVIVKGLHEFEDPKKAIEQATGIFTGGGNTFLLVKQLYAHDLRGTIQQAINDGTPYLGCSAGSNICGLTMETTNDMPITYPPSFKTFGFVPFNINPHYLDPIEGSTHMGETRETRINEFHTINSQPVVGLREGSWLKVTGNHIILEGALPARIFEQNKVAYEVEPHTDLSTLK